MIKIKRTAMAEGNPHKPSSIEKRLERYGAITKRTQNKLESLLELMERPYHVEIVVHSGCMYKTIDNEHDAILTIQNIKDKLKNNP